MKLINTLCLLATSTSTLAMIVVDDPGRARLPLPAVHEQPEVVIMEVEQPTAVEERQVPGQTLQQAATPPPTQYPAVTTQWWESTVAGGSTTYVEDIYTQLFSSVPQQWPSAGVGQIGYGTLKDKREAEPMVTPAPVGIAVVENDEYAVVLQLETVYITQPLQVVTEIVLLETLTVSGNVTYNGTITGGASTGFATGHYHPTASAWAMRGSNHRPAMERLPTGYNN